MQDKTRMLLSYNFAITENNDLSPLPRQEFAEFFATKFNKNYPTIACRPVQNPHWIVEIIFPKQEFSAAKVGEICAQFLANKRQQAAKVPDILALGGIKTTPSSNNSPDSLKTGEWGVDIVETFSAQIFLQAMAWETKTAGMNGDSIFKIELKN